MHEVATTDTAVSEVTEKKLYNKKLGNISHPWNEENLQVLYITTILNVLLVCCYMAITHFYNFK